MNQPRSRAQTSDNPFLLSRQDFRDLVNHALHPREEIDQPDQLKDRDAQLESLRDCFETPGAQAFIWGMKGVGKTSLAHTACEAHSDIVAKVAAVACEKDTSLYPGNNFRYRLRSKGWVGHFACPDVNQLGGARLNLYQEPL